MTGEGSAFARELSEALRRFEVRALSMLSSAEQKALVDTMHRLWENMENILKEEEN